MKSIQSLQNPGFKNALKLHTSRGRKQQKRIIIFGLRECRRAVASGVDIVKWFLCPNLFEGDTQDVLAQLTQSTEAEAFELTLDLFDRLKFGSRSDGVIAVANRPTVELESTRFKMSGPLLVLEGLENPGNLGAIMRSADGADAAGVIVVDPVTDVFHPNSIRASMGTVFSVPTAVASLETLQDWLEQNEISVFVTMPDADAAIFDCDLKGRAAIVFGNEANGVSSTWSRPTYKAFNLPMLGLADSLNVSVSVAICAYESLRQRTA